MFIWKILGLENIDVWWWCELTGKMLNPTTDSLNALGANLKILH